MKFVDDYNLLSGWIHDYYCDKDGTELIFDENNCNYYECPLCHFKYYDEKKKRAWITKYRYKLFSQLEEYSEKYLVNQNKKYMNFIQNALTYYADNYEKFSIHDKNGVLFDDYINESNSCGKITSQGLNEAMICIQIVNCINNVKDFLSSDMKEKIFKNLFSPIYRLLKPQINKIHNIQFYEICAIAMMGIVSNNKEMIDFAFNSEYSFYNQLDKGVTKDYFWYEGSFHYHLFILKPILEVLKTAKEFKYSILPKYYDITENMLLQVYKNSFNDCSLPSPNDGWPNRHLLDYLGVFKIGNDVFENRFKEILENIKSQNNRVSTIHSFNTGFSIIKNQFWNVFIKYKDNNYNHAHPDKLNIEIKQSNLFLTHDLSTSGYGSKLSKDYYKKTYSHSTLVINGKDQNLMCNGIVNFYDKNRIQIEVQNIYDNVNAKRMIEVLDSTLIDKVYVKLQNNEIVDYIFHCDAALITELNSIQIDKFAEYPYFSNIQKIICFDKNTTLRWFLGDNKIISEIDLDNKDLYICKSPDNPNLKERTTLLIRSRFTKNDISFLVKWTILK